MRYEGKEALSDCVLHLDAAGQDDADRKPLSDKNWYDP